jgi:hypothetical protein
MKIRLKGELDWELTRIGLKVDEEVEATPDRVGKTGAMYFDIYYRGWKYECVVWPENYELISNIKPVTQPKTN